MAHTVVEVRETSTGIVEVLVPGPQGPAADFTLAGLTDVNTSAKVNSSVLFYDSTTGMWVGNDVNTVTSITDGGNY